MEAASTCVSILRALVLVHIADLQQRIDEEAQADLGRQAPGAGVRRIDEAEFLEILHDIAYGGRRQRHRQESRQLARTDRIAKSEITVDDLPEDLA